MHVWTVEVERATAHHVAGWVAGLGARGVAAEVSEQPWREVVADPRTLVLFDADTGADPGADEAGVVRVLGGASTGWLTELVVAAVGSGDGPVLRRLMVGRLGDAEPGPRPDAAAELPEPDPDRPVAVGAAVLVTVVTGLVTGRDDVSTGISLLILAASAVFVALVLLGAVAKTTSNVRRRNRSERRTRDQD